MAENFNPLRPRFLDLVYEMYVSSVKEQVPNSSLVGRCWYNINYESIIKVESV